MLYTFFMDLEMLQFRANVMQKIRNFFIERGYLELDTPAMASCLIPAKVSNPQQCELQGRQEEDKTDHHSSVTWNLKLKDRERCSD